jgi:hypothetical protein
MLSFRQYLVEVLSYDNNNLWAMDASTDFQVRRDTSDIEHPDAFPHLNFMGREATKPWRGMPKRDAAAWGRIDNDNKVIHIITQHGFSIPTHFSSGSPSERARFEQDINHRLNALDKIQKEFPEYRIHAGGVEGDTPIIHTYDEHRKHLFGLLDQ